MYMIVRTERDTCDRTGLINRVYSFSGRVHILLSQILHQETSYFGTYSSILSLLSRLVSSPDHAHREERGFEQMLGCVE